MLTEKYLPSMVDLLRKLVETESPTQDKLEVNKVGKIIIEEAISLGAEIEIKHNEKTGNHIIARFENSFDQKEDIKDNGFLLLCHMDTVYPLGTILKMPFLEKGGRLLGPGIADMKSGAVIGLTAIKTLIENRLSPSMPITMLFTSDEETGSNTSRELIEELAKKSKLVLVLEPGMPDGSIKTWRKGVGDFHIEAFGQAAHSGGNHDKGRNAIEELAHQIIKIQGLTNYNLGTTLNVGLVHGGTVVNVVPDHAWMDVDMRVMQPSEAERITSELFKLESYLNGTTIKVTGGINRPPMPFTDLMHSTYEHAKEIADKTGISLTASGTGGASDANFISPLGIPVLDGLGAIGGDYHSESEYIQKDSLISRTELLAAFLQEW